MTSLVARVDLIVKKTENVIQLCEAYQEENDLLRLEVESLQVALNTSSEKIKVLEEKVKALAIVKSFEVSDSTEGISSEKKVETKQKIDKFVSEIDKCIDLLK